MKKIIIVIFIGMLIFSITACTENVIKNQEGEQPPNNQHTQDRIYEITEEEIIIGEGTEWELNGRLTLPKDAEGKVPAVVLVHGSGPSDMNGVPRALPDSNPFFKDIAEFLAQNGIAVIRYDKRTYTHAVKMVQQLGGSLTIVEETIEDAILAAEILRADLRIDESRVFILGHSMGGMLAPRIHVEGGNFAGIISLAGSPRSWFEIEFDQQMAYWEAMPDSDDKEYALSPLYRDVYYAEVESILNIPDDEAKNTPIGTGGTSAYYWKDFEKVPTSEYVKNIAEPFLVMQGSADFQVYADKDFAAWQELLAGRNNATLKLYESLNHIFMVSTTGDLEEYSVPGNVAPQVLQDIADWIKVN